MKSSSQFINDRQNYRKLQVYINTFDDLNDFLNYLINAPINRRIFGYHLASIDGSYEFTQTKSFEEAWDLCKFGWDDGFLDFRNKLKEVEFNFTYKQKYERTYKNVGTSPSVARFLLGIPNNMRKKQPINMVKTIDIYFNVGYSCNINADQIKNRGVLTLALIRYLESTNLYKINLHFLNIGYYYDEIIIENITLKKENRKFDEVLLKKCYFPMVNPSFLRRLLFRDIESTDVKENWSSVYGFPMHFAGVKNLFIKDLNNYIYIGTPDKLGIRGNNLQADFDSFINTIIRNYEHVFNIEEKEQFKKR